MDIFKRIFSRKQKDIPLPLEALPTSSSDGNHGVISTNQQTIIARDVTDSTIIQLIENNYAGPNVDEKLNEELEFLCKSRYYVDKNASDTALTLATKITEGEFRGGSEDVKSRALAWCSRILTISELTKAEVYYRLAKRLGSNLEVCIAEAFINSQKGQKQIALSLLAALDTSLSRSAALIIVSRHDGLQGAVDWITSTGITMADLCSEGKYHLISIFIQLSNWNSVNQCLKKVSEDDLQQTPVLNQLVAISNLINAVPIENRSYVINQVPFNANSFRLAADAEGIKARRVAHTYFLIAMEKAQHYNCLHSATLFEEFAIWLDLKDPERFEQGKLRLESKLRNPKTSLRFVYLGLQFGIKIDQDAVELEIDRQIALNGGITYDTAIARFALAFAKGNALDSANYITKHRENLAKYIDKKHMLFLQIEMFSEAGMMEKANECLELLKNEGLSASDEGHLLRIIADIDGLNPLELLKGQFNKSDSLVDLHALVEQLESQGEFYELIYYSEIMFSRTKALRDAEIYANALYKSEKYNTLLKFLDSNSVFFAQSPLLHQLYCWCLYIQGKFLEARSILIEIGEGDDSQNYRALRVNISIGLGDWDSLNSFVANELQKKEKRSAQELLAAAHLALQLGSPVAKELIVSAVSKNDDDANILSNAYLLSSSAGWEDDEGVSDWINKAASISGEDGPIRQMSLQDLLTMKPDWDRRETETLLQYNRGDFPMFLAAESLNKSLIETMLLPAFANLYEGDPRRRIGLPAFSGNRRESIHIVGSTLAIDATALITLGFLGILGNVMDAFNLIYLPHSTMHWLFEEKQKSSFHQPSRIEKASLIQHLYAKGVLEKVTQSTAPKSDLSDQIGDDLAILITEARMSNTPSLVIRPYPVHRISSLMQEEADLSEFSDILSSCLSIVDTLKRYGHITSDEYAKAQSYLRFQEKPWPKQPDVEVGATLFLDDLAVYYFLHLGLLEQIKSAGFRLIVTSRELMEANNLISYNNLTENIENVIESIRTTVSSRIELGIVNFGERHVVEYERPSLNVYPAEDFFLLAKYCNYLLVDDRFINQHANIAESEISNPTITTLDIIDWLEGTSLISSEQYFEYKTKLRRSGFLCPSNCR